MSSPPLHPLAGNIQLTGARYATELTLTSPLLQCEVSGFTVVRDDLLSTRMEFGYVYDGGAQHRFTVSGKVKDNSNARAAKYSGNL